MKQNAAVEQVIQEIVIANRMLAQDGVLDDFGHVSARHPDDPNHYLLSRARSPAVVERDDIVEFTLEGEPTSETHGRQLYSERALHGAIYMMRPDVHAICHHHAKAVLPYAVHAVPLRPVFHMASVLGHAVPVWDSQDEFGDTSMLVDTIEKGRSLGAALGANRTALLKRHGAVVVGGNVREVVFTSVYMRDNAELQSAAMLAGGDISYLTPGEIEQTRTKLFSPVGQARFWENRCASVGFAAIAS